MRLRVSSSAGLLVLITGVALLGQAHPPAAAAASGHASVTSSSQPVRHFNVGAAHSPQLLRQLAGSATATSSNSSTTAPAASPTPLANAIQGVDVSSFQETGGINWANTAAAGIKFAAIKATEGAYYVNPYARADFAAAKAAGLAVVAYAFAIPNGDGASSSPVVQADYAIAHAADQYGNVAPVMLDIEYDPYKSQDGTNDCYGLSQSAMATWISRFGAEVKTRTGRSAIIYTSTTWWSECVGGNTVSGRGPLWVAAFTGTSTPGTLPAGWSTWRFWQYGTGTVSGLSGTVDLDQLNPGVLSLLNPGNQQDVANSAITPVQVHASMTGLSFSASGLPDGLALDSSTGTITGTPTTLGSSNVTITATSTSPAATFSVSFTWYVHGTVTVSPPADQSTVAGSAVGVPVTATDSPQEPPVTFSAAGLPPGVSVTSGGLFTGWPVQQGTYQVTVGALDSLEAYGSASFTWTVTTAPDQGPTGPVRLDLGGKCLNDVGNSSTDGTEADIWTCNGSTAQSWTYVQDGTVRIHAKCLTMPASDAAGGKVRLEPCTEAGNQQWLLGNPRTVNSSAAAAPVALVNRESGTCLADPGWSTSNGTRVKVLSCNGKRNEIWTLRAGPVRSQIPGKCLDDSGNKTANGTKIDMWSCNGTAAQRWVAKPDGTVRIHGKCLDVHNSGTTSGTRVDLWTCNATVAQQWRLNPRGAGARLVNPHSGLCLADPGDATANGAWLQIITCSQAPGQGWRVQ